MNLAEFLSSVLSCRDSFTYLLFLKCILEIDRVSGARVGIETDFVFFF